MAKKLKSFMVETEVRLRRFYPVDAADEDAARKMVETWSMDFSNEEWYDEDIKRVSEDNS